jgi:hypothetical protein
MDFVQETDYRPHDVFPAETHERALDILTMICQELREMMSRALIAPPNQNGPIQYSDLAALLTGAEEALARALSARDAAQAEADRAAAAADSLDLPPLSTASPGQVLTAVEQPDQGLRLEYAGRPGVYELCEIYYFRSPVLRPGFQAAQGGIIVGAAELYPEAWAYLQTPEGQLLCKIESDWQALSTAGPWNGIGGVPWFVQNLEAGTLRLPDLRGMYREAAGFDGLAVGGAHPDAIVNITGWLHFGDEIAWHVPVNSADGAFRKDVAATQNAMQRPAMSNYAVSSLYFDASMSPGVRIANKVQPRAWGALACVYLGAPAS